MCILCRELRHLAAKLIVEKIRNSRLIVFPQRHAVFRYEMTKVHSKQLVGMALENLRRKGEE